MKWLLALVLSLNCLFAWTGAEAKILALNNQTAQEILNILVTPAEPERNPAFFLRLDLAPGRQDQVENPDCAGDLRVDTGLQFWNFKNVSLRALSAITFCGDHAPCLLLKQEDGSESHLSGTASSLIPPKGEKLVCELTRFAPGMAMKDVCHILDPALPVDDNGALITGLGFGGKVWAGRLAPDHPGPADGDSLLEHMELRREFAREDVKGVLATLEKQGYVPWQAEFPGSDMDFADMPLKGREALDKALHEFMERKPEQAGEAVIMLAPGSLVDALANADRPEKDVQLFTLRLKPASGVMILDVAAYKGEK